MRIFLSGLRPSGHVVLARVPQGASFTARFVDDAPEVTRDVTHMVADLLISGALDAAEARASGRTEPQEQVNVAVVSYNEPVTPAQVRPSASFTWVHVPSGEGGDFPSEDILALLVRGIGVELTTAIAAEAAEGAVPDDASSLTPEVQA